MWFDRRLEMRPSPIHGTGVFAKHPIRAGERLFFVSGGIVFTITDWRSGRVQLEPSRYDEAQIGELAAREIAAGEEITDDYALYMASPDYLLEPCACESPGCCGRVTGSDWRLPSLQQRCRGRFSQHIERLIRSTI